MPQAALQETEQQLLQLQAETEAMAGHLEIQTREVHTLQQLTAEQQAAMASNTKQALETEQRLTQDVGRLQVIFTMLRWWPAVLLGAVGCMLKMVDHHTTHLQNPQAPPTHPYSGHG